MDNSLVHTKKCKKRWLDTVMGTMTSSNGGQNNNKARVRAWKLDGFSPCIQNAPKPFPYVSVVTSVPQKSIPITVYYYCDGYTFLLNRR